MFLIFVLLVIFNSRDGLCNDRSSKEQFTNEADDVNVLSEGKNLYYLPQQTEFGRPGSVMGIDASKTSPPFITIKTSSTFQTKLATSEFSEEIVLDEDLKNSHSSYCTPEAKSKDLLDSELMPSKDVLHESIVLSGYMETPSKTTDDYHIPEVSNLVSISSDDKMLIGSSI